MKPRIPGPALLVFLAACADHPTGPLDPGREGDLASKRGVVTAEHAHPNRPGRRVAFYSGRDGNLEIYLMDADGERPLRLTSDPGNDTWPDISNNGKAIVFASDRAGVNTDIFLVGEDGGEPVNLTRTPAAAETWPRWSPNGHQVAFHGNATGNNEIYVLDLRDGSLARVTNHPGPDMWPEWAPDGHRLAFRRDHDVYVLDLRDGSTTRLTTHPALDQMAAWSPDGARLAFMSFREGYCSVFRMNADGTDQVNLTPKTSGENAEWCSRAPSWTDDGRILFMSMRPATAGDVELFIMEADGSGAIRLTYSEGEDGGPTAR